MYQETAKLYLNDDDISFYNLNNETASNEIKKALSFEKANSFEIIRVFVPKVGHFDYNPTEQELKDEVYEFE